MKNKILELVIAAVFICLFAVWVIAGSSIPNVGLQRVLNEKTDAAHFNSYSANREIARLQQKAVLDNRTGSWNRKLSSFSNISCNTSVGYALVKLSNGTLYCSKVGSTGGGGVSTVSSLSDLKAAIMSGSNHIILKAGTYTEDINGLDLSGHSNFWIEGEGKGITIIKWPDHTGTVQRIIDTQAGHNMMTLGGSNIKISDITLDGNKSNQNVVLTSDGITINKIRNGFSNFSTASSISIPTGSVIIPTHYKNEARIVSVGGAERSFTVDTPFRSDILTPETFYVSNPEGSRGIAVFGSVPSRPYSSITFDNIEVKNTVNRPILLWGINGLIIKNSSFHDGYTSDPFPMINWDNIEQSSPQIFGCQNVLIEDTDAYNNAADGIEFTGNADSIIDRGKYYNNGIGLQNLYTYSDGNNAYGLVRTACGIWANGTWGMKIKNVTAYSNTECGIAMANYDNYTINHTDITTDSFEISGNIVYNNFEDGIGIGAVKNGTVSNNIIYNNGTNVTSAYDYMDTGLLVDAGVDSYPTNNVKIFNNIIFDDQVTKTQKYGISYTGAVRNTVEIFNNKVINNGTANYYYNGTTPNGIYTTFDGTKQTFVSNLGTSNITPTSISVTGVDTSASISIQNSSSTSSRYPQLNIKNYGGNTLGTSSLNMYVARGTSTAPSSILSGDNLDSWNTYAYGSTGFKSVVGFQTGALETITDVNQAATLSLFLGQHGGNGSMGASMAWTPTATYSYSDLNLSNKNLFTTGNLTDGTNSASIAQLVASSQNWTKSLGVITPLTSTDTVKATKFGTGTRTDTLTSSSAPTVGIGSGSTGNWNNVIYYFVLTALNATSESLPSPEISSFVNGPAGQYAQLSWSPISGVTSYCVYVSTVSGDYSSARKNCTASTSLNWNDRNGSGSSAGSPPGASDMIGPIYAPQGFQMAVPGGTCSILPPASATGKVLNDSCSWVTTGTVTSVSSANGDATLSMASPTPVITINAATTGANKLLKLDGSGLITPSTLPAATTSVQGAVILGTGSTNAAAGNDTRFTQINSVNVDNAALSDGDILQYSTGSTKYLHVQPTAIFGNRLQEDCW